MIKQFEITDVRDGLTTLQRRILWTMKTMGLTSKKPYKRAIDVINIVGKGENLDGYDRRSGWIDEIYLFGVYETIYGIMVPMAQGIRYPFPLIAAQGNWGQYDGGEAAMAYFTGSGLSGFSEKSFACRSEPTDCTICCKSKRNQEQRTVGTSRRYSECIGQRNKRKQSYSAA